MSTPIFDALMAESDVTTRALVRDALTPNVEPHRTTDDVHADGLLAGIGDYS